MFFMRSKLVGPDTGLVDEAEETSEMRSVIWASTKDNPMAYKVNTASWQVENGGWRTYELDDNTVGQGGSGLPTQALGRGQK